MGVCSLNVIYRSPLYSSNTAIDQKSLVITYREGLISKKTDIALFEINNGFALEEVDFSDCSIDKDRELEKNDLVDVFARFYDDGRLQRHPDAQIKILGRQQTPDRGSIFKGGSSEISFIGSMSGSPIVFNGKIIGLVSGHTTDKNHNLLNGGLEIASLYDSSDLARDIADIISVCQQSNTDVKSSMDESLKLAKQVEDKYPCFNENAPQKILECWNNNPGAYEISREDPIITKMLDKLSEKSPGMLQQEAIYNIKLSNFCRGADYYHTMSDKFPELPLSTSAKINTILDEIRANYICMTAFESSPFERALRISTLIEQLLKNDKFTKSNNFKSTRQEIKQYWDETEILVMEERQYIVETLSIEPKAEAEGASDIIGMGGMNGGDLTAQASQAQASQAQELSAKIAAAEKAAAEKAAAEKAAADKSKVLEGGAINTNINTNGYKKLKEIIKNDQELRAGWDAFKKLQHKTKILE